MGICANPKTLRAARNMIVQMVGLLVVIVVLKATDRESTLL